MRLVHLDDPAVRRPGDPAYALPCGLVHSAVSGVRTCSTCA
ncbi:hypothetical protein ROS62_12025 [Streptomyces sp. DSM 41972]|uniref:Uncharacterized protein n=1 Tax=Streptomyces althioticus subsp. attaecolombicae TaxID=3075534 RepID=A0ABU3HXZ3_9ACTN|nr:hypothetical protein [Streptomyces sp. DSM 41972]